MKSRGIQYSLMICIFFLLSSNVGLAGGTSLTPLTVNFVNQAADISGLWDDAIRSDFVEAMNVAANNASASWRHGRPIVVSANVKGRMRLIVVDGPLYYGKTQVGGYHGTGAKGPFAIFDLTVATQEEGAGGPFLFGSHELDEMLADPGVNRVSHSQLVEIADPVVCCHYDLTLTDTSVVPVSDFVLPAWYKPNAAGPFDFINSPYIQAPFQLGPGGY